MILDKGNQQEYQWMAIMNWYKKANIDDQEDYSLCPEKEYARSIGLDPDSLGYMGKGENGEAFDAGNGRIIKVTSSSSEFEIAKKLLGKSGYHATIYDVQQIGNSFIIYQEMLQMDSDIEYKYYQLQELLNQQGLPMQYLGHLDEDELSPEDKLIYDELSDFITGIENINREYRYLGIEASDIQPDNMGYDNQGNLKAFDLDDKGGIYNELV